MLEYYLWKEHVGHQLEAREGSRTIYLDEGEREEQEATVVLRCLTCGKEVEEYSHTIALRWNLEDIQTIAHLTQGEAEVVLEELEHDHDASIGVNWQVIESVIERLFPEATFVGSEN
jgi:hypothetical protein